MIRMLWMGGWHCALTQQPPSKISIQFLLTKKATSFSPLDSFFPELRLLSSSFFSPPSFLMSWLFDKILSAAVAGCCFCLLQQHLSGEKGGTVPYTPRAPFFSKNSFLLLLCRQGGERRGGGRGAEANFYKTTETSAKSF